MKKKNKLLLSILESLLIGILAFCACYFDIFYALDSLYKDRLYQQPRNVNQSIKIIAIDEKTLGELGPYGTWPRSTYATLLENLGDYPSVVGFDIMFIGNMDEEDDAVFEETLKKNDNVVMTSHIVFDTAVVANSLGKVSLDTMHVAGVEYPFCNDYVKTGYANISPDSDGVVRAVVPNLSGMNTFSYEVYSLYCEKHGIAYKPPKTDDSGKQWIYYAGKPFEYEAVSLIDVLNGNIDPRVFTDCIVLVGAYATGLLDQFAVPNSTNQMFGVEINANIIQGYLDDSFVLQSDRLLTALFTALLVSLIFFLFSRLKITYSTILLISLEAVIVFLGIMFFTKKSLCIPGIYAAIFVFLSYIVTLAIHYANEWLEKRKISSAFRKYVAPQVVDEMIKTGKYQLKLGGETRDMAVLFVDIRGFTPLSESLEPEQVVEILNRYLSLTTNSIFANNGTLDKFIGDATMAVFNAPFNLENYEIHALKAALAIVAGAEALEAECMEKFGRKVTFGVGVNCGPAVVGNIGCEFRMDYTAIGDTVNTAARLEANAAPGQVLISETLYNRVKDKGVIANPIGELQLKGKANKMPVYELIGINEEKEEYNK